MMGIYLVALSTLRKGDKVVVSELNYQTVNLCFNQCGGELVYIPVDGQGLNTHELEKFLEKQAIRLLYITSHHHYPTTVSLSTERRIQLYNLAKKYQFLILEDDYDFDYHYQNTPTLPLASMDTESLVIYVGSFSKLLYPGIRLGFAVAPPILIEEMSKHRWIIDLQGDHLMERTIANLMLEGVMDRYLRKSKALYKKRKEHFCQLLREEFNVYLEFTEPEGGMAVWATFNE
jgi:GntR family transcriptional regulator/MocR family aminotransferase